MRLINPEDSKEFVDESGDKLIVYREPTHYMFGLREATVTEEGAALMKTLGIDMNDPDFSKKAKDAKADLDKKNDEGEKNILRNPAIRRWEFLAVTLKLVIAGREITSPDEIATAYDHMLDDTGKWVDECVSSVWDAAEPTESEKN